MASGQPDGQTAKVGDLTTPIAGLDGSGNWQAVSVDTTGAVNIAAGATGLGKAEDTPHVSGDVGVMMLAVRNDGGATTYGSAVGDYVPLTTTINGHLMVAALQDTFQTADNLNAPLHLWHTGRNGQTGGLSGAIPMSLNGIGVDRQRNNEVVTVLASAARTATTNSSDLTNFNGRGVQVIIDVTAVTGSASVTVALQTKETIGSKYVTVLTSAAITGTGQTRLRCYPGITAVANESVSDLIGRIWRVVVTHGTADSITYSVQCVMML